MAMHWVADAGSAADAWRFEEYAVPGPGPGEVTIRVRAAGMNPADRKHVEMAASGGAAIAIGYEVSGSISAIGPDTRIGSGEVRIGDEVLAFRVRGGYATEVTVPAEKVFHKPASLSHPEAANLLLVGTTAAEMLEVVSAVEGETVLLHGASGAVGVSVLQQAALRGVRVIGTASPARFDEVRRFGGVPVAYGPGLADRVRAVAGTGVVAALDAVGTDEALDVSTELVAERTRIVSIVARARAEAEGMRWIAGSLPESAAFRDRTRPELIALAARGALVVPLARTYPLAQALEATHLLASEHPGGKLALIP